MGKSPSSCFKIIPCGANSTDVDDDDDLEHSENKQSSDKRRWSFRKRSARQRVPSNPVISEPQFVGFNKENPEATTDKFYSVNNSSVPDKTQVVEQENVTEPLSVAVANTEEAILREQTNETSPLSSVVINLEIPPIIEQANETPPSSSAVVNSEVEAISDTPDVTTSVDANLQENIIIIQAAARRFLTRRKIQKVKNVIKLQSTVRGHLVRRQAVGTLRCVQAIFKMQALVRARHARRCQLLDKSSVREKNDEKFLIDSWNSEKSDQTKHTVAKLLSNGFAQQLLDSSPSKTKPIYISCDPLRHDSAWQWLERWMSGTSSKLKVNNSSAYEELDVVPVAEDSSPGKVNTDQCISFLTEGNKEQYPSEGDIKEENMAQTENLRHDTKIASSEAMENDGKKLDLGSRKVRNPAFAAVQAKFEELSSAPKSSRSPSVEPKPDHSQVLAGNPYIQNPISQVATSECGTEISISSTLDSPDISETDGGEIVIEIETSRVANHNTNFSVGETFSLENNVVATESHGTPSSQVSIQSSKTVKTPNNIVARRIKSKDLKNANKPKFDNEPRCSSSSSSLPSYMQVTESARAKAQGSLSLESSPDVHEKDYNLKKRHSFPIGDEKQGSSPRAQRSTSQKQQSLKRNNNHSPHSFAERRWVR